MTAAMAIPDTGIEFPKSPEERRAMMRMITDLTAKVGRLEAQVEGNASRAELLEHTVHRVDAKVDKLDEKLSLLLEQNARSSGEWATIKRVGIIGWTVIGALAWAAWTLADRLHLLPGGVK